ASAWRKTPVTLFDKPCRKPRLYGRLQGRDIRRTRDIQAGRERARDANVIGASGLEGLDCHNDGGRPLHALSFHPLARTHADVMEAFRSHRRKKRREDIPCTGHQLPASGQACNERPPCSLSVCHLPMPYSCGSMLAMLVTIGLEIVKMWSSLSP